MYTYEDKNIHGDTMMCFQKYMIRRLSNNTWLGGTQNDFAQRKNEML